MMLASVVASGYKVPIGDAAITALLGYGVVFFGLFMLMIVVIIMGKIMNASKAKEAPAAPAHPARNQVSAADNHPTGRPCRPQSQRAGTCSTGICR